MSRPITATKSYVVLDKAHAVALGRRIRALERLVETLRGEIHRERELLETCALELGQTRRPRSGAQQYARKWIRDHRELPRDDDPPTTTKNHPAYSIPRGKGPTGKTS